MKFRFIAVFLSAMGLVTNAQTQDSSGLHARELFYTPPPDATPAPRPPTNNKIAPKRTAPPAQEVKQAAKTDAKAPSPSSPAPAAQHTVSVAAVPLGVRYSVLKRNSANQFVEVDPDTTFHSGDRIRLQVRTNTTGYLYVVAQGSSGTWQVLFPASDRPAPSAGSLQASETPNPVIASPSLELNVTLRVWLAPTATDICEVFAAAITVSSAPCVLPSPPTPPTGPVPLPPVVDPPVPPPVLPETLVAPYSEPPLLLPQGEEKSQPDRSTSADAPTRTERWTNRIAIHPKKIGSCRAARTSNEQYIVYVLLPDPTTCFTGHPASYPPGPPLWRRRDADSQPPGRCG